MTKSSRHCHTHFFILSCLLYSQFVSPLTIHTNNNIILAGNNDDYLCPVGVELTCRYSDDSLIGKEIEWIQYHADTIETKRRDVIDGHDPATTRTINYTVVSSGNYSCRYNNKKIQRSSYNTFNLSITLINGIQICSDLTHPALSSYVITSSITPTPSGAIENVDHLFAGTNPLIYVSATAILLGILTLIAIITCWLRSRKRIRQQPLFPRESPLDYLDYIREGQFTPMTSSDFLASLSERPPTYNESQEIERRLLEETTEQTGSECEDTAISDTQASSDLLFDEETYEHIDDRNSMIVPIMTSVTNSPEQESNNEYVLVPVHGTDL